MLGQLYTPSGLAFETAKAALEVDNPHAVNIALGCSNGCLYCYGPQASRQGREKYRAIRMPKDTPLNLVKKQIEKGLKVEGVLMSFLTDPYLPQLCKQTEELVNYLLNWGDEHGQEPETATLSKLGVSKYSRNRNGLTIVSPYKGFSTIYEPDVPSPQERLKLLDQLAYDGEDSWVSIEPFPVQDIYPYDMKDITRFWEELSDNYVGFIIFGKWNYDKRANTEKARQEYAEIVPLFIDFCQDHGIRYHIKSDTLAFIKSQDCAELRRAE